MTEQKFVKPWDAYGWSYITDIFILGGMMVFIRSYWNSHDLTLFRGILLSIMVAALIVNLKYDGYIKERLKAGVGFIVVWLIFNSVSIIFCGLFYYVELFNRFTAN